VRFKRLLIFVFCAAGLFASMLSAQNAEFSLSIAEFPSEETNCECFAVIATKTNLTDATLHITIKGLVETFFEYSVRMNGVKVAESKTLKKERKAEEDSDFVSLISANIKPHESGSYYLHVGKYYDMSKPGTYEITVLQNTHPDEPSKNIVVSSNTLTYTVPPKGK